MLIVKDTGYDWNVGTLGDVIKACLEMIYFFAGTFRRNHNRKFLKSVKNVHVAFDQIGTSVPLDGKSTEKSE